MPPAEGPDQSEVSARDATDRLERKRVLNVLAQRRYRQRQKQKLQHYNSAPGGHPKPQAESTTPCLVPTRASCNLTEGRVQDIGSGSQAEEHNASDLPSLSNIGFDPILNNGDAGLDTLFPYLGIPTGVPLLNNIADPTSAPDPSSLAQGGTTWQDFQDFTFTSTWLQTDETASATFADDRTFEVPLLNLLNATQILAGHMRSLDRMFDVSATSIFNTSTHSETSWSLALPQNLQPVPAQYSIQHHPCLDLIPWPSVRTKLICMFSTPAASGLRDPKDGSLLDVPRFFHDVDEGGLVVSGEEPARTESWEIGSEEFLRTWWWAFAGDVVSQTNAKRRKRGLPALTYATSAPTHGS